MCPTPGIRTSIEFWDTRSRAPIHTLCGHTAAVNAVAFSADEKLLVSDQTTRVTSYQVGEWERVESWDPQKSMLEWAYRYSILPAHKVLPKPGEYDRTVEYLITGDESVATEVNDNSLHIF